MMPSPAALAFLAYCDGTIFTFVTSSTHMGGATILVYYHSAPAPDGFLARRLFARDIHNVRQGEWTMADDGSLYTLPIGSEEVRIGRMSN